MGLGNPGSKYANTRHNAGFMAAERLAACISSPARLKKFNSHITAGKLEGKSVAVVKPQTFMNLSGEAAGMLMKHYRAKLSQFIIIYDDAALSMGKVRIRERGSCGGHNGMRSIADYLHSEEITRIRIGIGKPDEPIIDFVLTEFTPAEREALDAALAIVPDAVRSIMNDGVQAAMSKYN